MRLDFYCKPWTFVLVFSVEIYLGTYSIGNEARERQAQTGTWGELVDLEEAFEDMLTLARGNATSGVSHREDGAVVLVFCTFDHDTALFGELDGIVDQAEQHAHNAFPLCDHGSHSTAIAE